MPVNAVMPMGGMLPEHASCFRWISRVFLILAVLRWLEPVAGGAISVDPPPLNKLAGRPDLRVMALLLLFFFGCRGGGREEEPVVVSPLLRAVEAVRPLSSVPTVVGLRIRHPPWWQPASASSPSHPLVEWRPIGVVAFVSADVFYSSRHRSHMGGSRSSPRRSHPLSLACSWRGSSGGFPAPSGVVPGGGETGSRRRFPGTELLFSFVIWGPFYKNPGPSCVSLLVWGPGARCNLLWVN